MFRTLALTVFVCAFCASANAQPVDAPEPPRAEGPALSEAHNAGRAEGWSAPALRVSLASTFIGLQALDVVTTLHGVNGGAVEANPLMGGLAQRPAAFVAVKSGLTAATLISMHSLSKKHPKAAALAMVAINVGSALVVRSNYRIVVSR